MGTGCLFFLFLLQPGEGQGQLHMAFLLLVVIKPGGYKNTSYQSVHIILQENL